jgi:hypothetical protein
MSPLSVALAEPDANLAQEDLLPAGRCFIGIPGRGAAVDVAGLTSAVRRLLDRHEQVLVLIESELMSYGTCVLAPDFGASLQQGSLNDRVSDDTLVSWHEVDGVRKALPVEQRARVHIASWAHFSDPTFAALWRQLLNAFEMVSRFRRDALLCTRAVGPRRFDDTDAAPTDRADSLCRVESLAMRLRLAEVAGYHHEYGWGEEDVLIRRLYSGAYANDGLTVDALVGNPAKRVYREL